MVDLMCYVLVFWVLCRSDGILLGCVGFHGDVLTVTKRVKAQMKVGAEFVAKCSCQRDGNYCVYQTIKVAASACASFKVTLKIIMNLICVACEFITGVRVCGVRVCGVRVCGVRMCGVRVCGVRVCGVRVCGVRVCCVCVCGVHVYGVRVCDVCTCGIHVYVCVLYGVRVYVVQVCVVWCACVWCVYV